MLTFHIYYIMWWTCSEFSSHFDYQWYTFKSKTLKKLHNWQLLWLKEFFQHTMNICLECLLWSILVHHRLYESLLLNKTCRDVIFACFKNKLGCLSRAFFFSSEWNVTIQFLCHGQESLVMKDILLGFVGSKQVLVRARVSKLINPSWFTESCNSFWLNSLQSSCFGDPCAKWGILLIVLNTSLSLAKRWMGCSFCSTFRFH